jgi:hypothetical protein
MTRPPFGGDGRAGSPSPAGRPARLDAPAVDLNRLTDQVIAAIDRRVVARRERLGRG